MKRRIILSGDEARDQLSLGAQKLAEGVARTLGPFGENWFLDAGDSITNDGVKVASEIQLPNEVQNRGAKAIREAAVKTVEQVGDGTTTAILLAWEIYKEFTKFLGSQGVIGRKPAELIAQAKTECVEIIEKLKGMATPIGTREDLVHSATVAVEDPELGQIIGSLQWELGKDGFVMAEQTAERRSYSQRVPGIRADNGIVSSMLINNHEKQTLEIFDTHVILSGHSVRSPQQIEKIIQDLAKRGVPRCTIIAQAFTPETINICAQNINKGQFQLWPVNAPYTDMSEMMKDIAAITGAKYYEAETSRLEDMMPTDVGHAEKIEVHRWHADIVGRKDEKATERIDKRLEEIKLKLEQSKSDFEREEILRRIAQLTNGFGVVKIGAYSQMERERLFDKADDCVHAVRAAFGEGTVEGAGLAFKAISEELPDTYLLKRPLLCIYDRIMYSAPKGFVIESWVRDPVKVLRIALLNAVESAAAFASAAGVVTEAFPKELDEILVKRE